MSATITIGPLQASNNLSDISSRSAGRGNIGIIGDGINVQDAATGTPAVFDGQDGYFYVAFTASSTSVAINGPTYTATIAQGSPTLTLTNASPAWYPQPEDIGKRIAVAGAGAGGSVLFTTILNVDSGNTPQEKIFTLATNALTALSAATGTIVLWPYFEASDVGKTIWLSQGGGINNNGRASGGSPYGCNGPLIGTIAGVSAYNAFTLNANPTSPCNGFMIRAVWGTDNTNAVIAARNLAANRGLRRYHYENGSATPALCCAFNMLGSQAAYDALSNGHHFGNNVSSFFTDSLGNMLRYMIVPASAWNREPLPLQPRMVARAHLPCSLYASTVIYTCWGDSMALDSPLGQSPAFSQMTRVFQRIRASNIGTKTLDEGQNFAIGGAIWQWLNKGNPYAAGSVGWPALPIWYTANTTDTWDQFINAATPTIIDLLENGGNDRQYVHQPSAQAVIQNVRNSFTKTGGIAPDLIMCNMRPWPITSTNAVPLFVDQNGEEKPALLHRSMGRVQTIGFLDYFDIAHLYFFGWSPARLKSRIVPSFTTGVTGSVNTPVGIGQPCRDFDIRMVLGASQAGAAVWGQSPLYFLIGGHPQNMLRFGLDSTSTYLTMRAHTWGCVAGELNNPAPTISITNGAAALTVASPTAATVTSYVSAVLDPVSGGTLITTTGFNWPTGCLGQMLLIPAAQFTWSGAPAGTGDFVTQIIGRISTSEILVADSLPVPGVAIASWGLSAVYAPILFSKVMADAAADVILSDGTTTLVTKITTYTSSTQVTLAANWTGTTRAAYNTGTSMFLGRMSIPTITCNGSNGTSAIAAGTALSTGPTLQISARNDDLEVSYFPYYNSYTPTATVSITATAAVLTSTTSIFEPGMVGQAIQVPGAGAAGAVLNSYIKTYSSGTSVTLTSNAQTTLSSVSKTLSIANGVAGGGGGQAYPMMVYRGPVERFGGQFIPVAIPNSSLNIGFTTSGSWIGVPDFFGPCMLEYEAWGTQDQFYAFGGAGGTHNNAAQSAVVDEVVLSAQDWTLSPGLGATSQASIAAPAAPSSTSAYQMQGLAAAITPQRTGSVLFIISGTITSSSGTAAIGVEYQISYGTGSAPSTNGTLAGTQAGDVQTYTNAAALTAADIAVPFSIQVVVQGLTGGTTYWIDLAAKALNTASDCGFTAVSVTAVEL